MTGLSSGNPIGIIQHQEEANYQYVSPSSVETT